MKPYRPPDRSNPPLSLDFLVGLIGPPAFRFRMGEHGWAYLDVAQRAQIMCAKLSYAFSPFGNIADWGLCVQSGDLPIEVGIDQEGYFAYLSAHPASDPEWIEFYVEDDDGTVLVRCACKPNELTESLRQEKKRFFESEFDDASWHVGADEDDPPSLTRERFMERPFLKGCTR